MIRQGEVYWADLPPPRGSGPGFRRPVVVLQSDVFNASQLRTVVCVPLTSNLRRAASPGNVLLPAESTGLSQDSVASVPLIVSLDRSYLLERAGRISESELQLVMRGADLVLGQGKQSRSS